MKRKVVFAVAGLFIFVTCFVVSIQIYDYVRKQKLKSNLQKISVGMSEDEVIKILGKPDHIWGSDEPVNYWCYDTNTISHALEEQPEIECGNITLRMSFMKNGEKLKTGQVMKIYEIK